MGVQRIAAAKSYPGNLMGKNPPELLFLMPPPRVRMVKG
jgi:hypothetical protein